ncbi:Crp/Fnr family transcriptional regulator [Tellurirhabdus bombi]|uniref:Crp/Fnr family transcriptional regulator n=1 Tax=Tellurirhabdus bombi TaxID=2907205 RepID=UPI001F17996C|nr:Crp/Fnr family transcriptional regulator [Tellurirhabdus bombi]
MNPLLALVQQLSPLSAESQRAFEQIIRFDRFPKNTELLSIGAVSRHLYFIHRGLARVFYYKEDIDVTDYFAVDNQFIGAVASLFTGAPSNKGIQVLEDSEVYYLNNVDFEQLADKHHDLERVARKLAVFGFLESQSRLESLQFLSAKERYQELNRQYPGLTNRAPLKYIASYLGITQVSLSRIRAEL